MKKLFLFSVAALAFCACSSDETVSENNVSNQQPKEISFSPLAKPNTRSTTQYAIDGTTFPTTQDMYVAAYQVEPTGTNYFEGTNFTYNSTASTSLSTPVWSGTTKRYWPLSPAYINFLAYANVTGSAAFNATNYASEAVITQTDNSSTQTDLMYAIGHGEVTQNSTNNALTFPQDVPMVFKHAQAWMDFYVKANSDVEKAITVNSITLNGAKYSGTYTITHTNYNQKVSQTVAGVWTAAASQGDYAVPGWSATALTTSPVQVGKGLLVVPDDNSATNDWTSFVINYTYDGKTYDYTYNAPAEPNASLQQAKHYVFNITFKLHEIYVAATVADWEDVTTSKTIEE